MPCRRPQSNVIRVIHRVTCTIQQALLTLTLVRHRRGTPPPLPRGKSSVGARLHASVPHRRLAMPLPSMWPSSGLAGGFFSGANGPLGLLFESWLPTTDEDDPQAEGVNGAARLCCVLYCPPPPLPAPSNHVFSSKFAMWRSF